MQYDVTFGDVTFRAAYFDMQHSHPGDTFGMPGAVDTQITLRLWVLSTDPTNISSDARKALFEYANAFRDDERAKPQVLTMKVVLNAAEGSHKYAIENAWLKYFSEYQETTYDPDFVDVTIPRVDPNETVSSHAKVQKGIPSNHTRLELLFVGFIEADQGSRID